MERQTAAYNILNIMQSRHTGVLISP